mgnify:CR=1 FL=1
MRADRDLTGTAEFVRAIARPVCVMTLCATLAVCALIETCGGGECPNWFAVGTGIAIVEWITERALKRAKNKDGGHERIVKSNSKVVD